MGDREPAKGPAPAPHMENERDGTVSHDDQRQIVENQDMSGIEKADRKR